MVTRVSFLGSELLMMCRCMNAGRWRGVIDGIVRIFVVPYDVVGEAGWWYMVGWVWSVGKVDLWVYGISHKEWVDSQGCVDSWMLALRSDMR